MSRNSRYQDDVRMYRRGRQTAYNDGARAARDGEPMHNNPWPQRNSDHSFSTRYDHYRACYVEWQRGWKNVNETAKVSENFTKGEGNTDTQNTGT
jgi:hypothetical protein